MAADPSGGIAAVSGPAVSDSVNTNSVNYNEPGTGYNTKIAANKGAILRFRPQQTNCSLCFQA